MSKPLTLSVRRRSGRVIKVNAVRPAIRHKSATRPIDQRAVFSAALVAPRAAKRSRSSLSSTTYRYPACWPLTLSGAALNTLRPSRLRGSSPRIGRRSSLSKRCKGARSTCSRRRWPSGAASPITRPWLSSRYTSTLGLTSISWLNRLRRASGFRPLASINWVSRAMCCARSRDKPCTTSSSCIWLARTCIHTEVPLQISRSRANTSDRRWLRVSFMSTPARWRIYSRAPRP